MNRLDYILYIQDLMDEKSSATDEIYGIDLGVGASCIYALLGCSLRKNWNFVGTEINGDSIEYAQENINRNLLQDRIHIIQNKRQRHLFPKKLLQRHEKYDFCMCNPPFYKDMDHAQELASSKVTLVVLLVYESC